MEKVREVERVEPARLPEADTLRPRAVLSRTGVSGWRGVAAERPWLRRPGGIVNGEGK